MTVWILYAITAGHSMGLLNGHATMAECIKARTELAENFRGAKVEFFCTSLYVERSWISERK